MRVYLLLASIVVAAACGSDSPTDSGGGVKNKTVDIFTVGDQFSPTFPTLAPGDTARWNFAVGSMNMGHNVQFNSPKPAGTPTDITVKSSGTDSRVFTTKGTFNYSCTVHPGMNAQIVVQ
jgi:plastocyanin